MKIIRHPKRQHNLAHPLRLSTNPTDVIISPPRKKALLIGINTTLMEGGRRKSDLKMPHEDVRRMKALLIDTYQYHPNDVITLIDSDDPKQPWPTMVNIRAEMKNLVADARRGDRFFFHYSGHVVQKDNLDGSEEDGKDECLVPCDSDGERNIIMDDDLRDILVDRLPRGCQLVAVLDSCHSGSLLDLEHDKCNRVWTPWVSKGRRKSDPIRNDVRRHNALVVYQNTRISGDRVKQRKTTLHPSPSSPLAHRELSQEVPTRPDTLNTSTSPFISPTSTFTQKKLTRALTKLDLNATKSINTLRKSPTWTSSSGQQLVNRSRSLKTIKSQFAPWLDVDQVDENRDICDSPVQQFCDGQCRHNPRAMSPASPRSPETLDIISLASCKDSQEAWEDSEGHSMSQMLVEILKQDPHPTLKDLMVTVSHRLHDAAVMAHSQTKLYKKRVVQFREKHPEKSKARSDGDTSGLNLNDFQDPQLSSRRPLNMDRRWKV
ncbi:caspase domain-containing protein [Rhodocollybia butyracea]|uniref:Caspase domain-containing protein n=1 Tax=Rhodocollybia butyracea TaxID=206335 RepID=A0A9P5UGT1_9AGAR|nr:caspase domain-containing protein [Rhodocollybia butyracea]